MQEARPTHKRLYRSRFALNRCSHGGRVPGPSHSWISPLTQRAELHNGPLRWINSIAMTASSLGGIFQILGVLELGRLQIFFQSLRERVSAETSRPIRAKRPIGLARKSLKKSPQYCSTVCSGGRWTVSDAC